MIKDTMALMLINNAQSISLEFLEWKATQAMISIGWGILFLIVIASALVLVWRKTKVGRNQGGYVDPEDVNDRSFARWVAGILSALFASMTLLTIMTQIDTLVHIKMAPRAYVIEYLIK